MRETNAIYTDYRADGFKTSRINRTIYITTATKVNSKGETIVYDKSTGVDNQRYYYGNLMKENGKVKHIYNEAGYVDVHEDDGTYCYNFYVRDYLGSTRAVVNQWGDLAQTTDYYPSGVPTTEYKSYWFDDRLHTGKEFNAFNGLFWYDNAARMLDPIFNRFTSPDPLAEKYPNLSPYAHCANNPLKYIDPTGMDIWELDDNGNIVTHTETTDEDSFYTIDNEGKRKKDADGKDVGITFKYGTIKQQKSNTYKNKDGSISSYDVYTARGDENGDALFEFLSDNISGSESKVELSLAKTGESGDKGLNFITTGHKRGSEPGMKYLLEGQLFYGYTIRSLSHSHPNGESPSANDIEQAKQISAQEKKYGFNVPTFNLYHVPTKKYINYKP